MYMHVLYVRGYLCPCGVVLYPVFALPDGTYTVLLSVPFATISAQYKYEKAHNFSIIVSGRADVGFTSAGIPW